MVPTCTATEISSPQWLVWSFPHGPCGPAVKNDDFPSRPITFPVEYVDSDVLIDFAEGHKAALGQGQETEGLETFYFPAWPEENDDFVIGYLRAN